MKKLLLVFIFLFTPLVQADELMIPFSCWPKELQSEFKKVGKKLDLDGSQRTDDSWGYILNKGSKYTIYTYRSVTSKDFDLIHNIVFTIEKEKNG